MFDFLNQTVCFLLQQFFYIKNFTFLTQIFKLRKKIEKMLSFIIRILAVLYQFLRQQFLLFYTNFFIPNFDIKKEKFFSFFYTKVFITPKALLFTSNLCNKAVPG